MDTPESKVFIVAGIRRDVVANDLALMVPVSAALVEEFRDLAGTPVKVPAWGEPATVPAGIYAQQTLNDLALSAAIERKTIFAKDVRQVLTYVETGNADRGIVYKTERGDFLESAHRSSGASQFARTHRISRGSGGEFERYPRRVSFP
jgi:molybdate transport system substrate-binding protein